MAHDAVLGVRFVGVQATFISLMLLPYLLVEVEQFPHLLHGWVMGDGVEPLPRQPFGTVDAVGWVPEGWVWTLEGLHVQLHVVE